MCISIVQRTKKAHNNTKAKPKVGWVGKVMERVRVQVRLDFSHRLSEGMQEVRVHEEGGNVGEITTAPLHPSVQSSEFFRHR